MASPALPSALSPLSLRPHRVAMVTLTLLVVGITLTAFGMTLPLLLSLAVALPFMARGEGRKAAWALGIAGFLPLALGGFTMVSYELSKAASTDPLYSAKNHEFGFMSFLFTIGVGLPSVLAGLISSQFATRMVTLAARGSLDAGDDILSWGGVASSVTAYGMLTIVSFAHIALPSTAAALPSLSLVLFAVTITREIRRRRALIALHEGRLPGLQLVDREAPLDLPSLVDPGAAPLDRVLVASAQTEGGPYRESDTRTALALAPLGLAACEAALRRRLLIAGAFLTPLAFQLIQIPKFWS